MSYQTIQKMEKFIFDSRQNQTDSPKFLKRNYNVSKEIRVPMQPVHDYLQNKVFVTFDYSYYHDLAPKHSSLHFSQRMNSLQSLMATMPIQQKFNDPSLLKNPKWKYYKIKKHCDQNRSTLQNKKKSKILSPKVSYPCIGYYNSEHTSVHKKIVHNIKIQGRPKESQNKDGDKKQKNPKISLNFKQNKTKATGRPNSYHNKERMHTCSNKAEQDYHKFMTSIEIGSVWKKLMEKHRLKGTKFDFHSPTQ